MQNHHGLYLFMIRSHLNRLDSKTKIETNPNAKTTKLSLKTNSTKASSSSSNSTNTTSTSTSTKTKIQSTHLKMMEDNQTKYNLEQCLMMGTFRYLTDSDHINLNHNNNKKDENDDDDDDDETKKFIKKIMEQFKMEKLRHERIMFEQMEENRLLRERLEQMEQELLNMKQNRMICSICFDPIDEIIHSGRSLMSTFCGHIFCDQCLRRTMVGGDEKRSRDAREREQRNGGASSSSKRKKFTCPRCRKTIPTMIEHGKYSHQLYI